MKKIKADVKINVTTKCPYCGEPVDMDFHDFEKYNLKDLGLEVHPKETVVRGIAKRLMFGSGEVADIPVNCLKCLKKFIINELDY